MRAPCFTVCEDTERRCRNPLVFRCCQAGELRLSRAAHGKAPCISRMLNLHMQGDRPLVLSLIALGDIGLANRGL